MTLDSTRLRQYAPYLAPVVIVGLGWGLFIRPIASQSDRVARDLDGLRRRIESVRREIGTPQPPPEPLGDPAKAFERQVTTGDASGRVMEELSRRAAAAGLQLDTIESATEGTASSGGPVATGGAVPDPRLALFQAPLKYTPVMLTAEADYRSVGEFLWNLRDLSTLVEIRSLEIVPPAVDPQQSAPSAGSLRMTMTLFAYSRQPGATGEAE